MSSIVVRVPAWVLLEYGVHEFGVKSTRVSHFKVRMGADAMTIEVHMCRRGRLFNLVGFSAEPFPLLVE